MELSRRTLLKAGIVGSAGAAIAQVPNLVPGGAPTLEQLAALNLARDLPEEWMPSACATCAAACPVTLRRIGGNIVGVRPSPEGACARAYTIPQEIVHPDRVRSPLKRSGDRRGVPTRPGTRAAGGGVARRGGQAFQPIPPDAALQELADLLGRSKGKAAIVVRESAALSLFLLKAFGRAIGAAHVVTDEWPLSQGPVDALEQATGWPHWEADLAHADGVISFGWDWLQAHPYPVEAQRAFARLRQKGAPLFFVGPRFNMTAMRSREWIACRPGFEPLVALCLAHLVAQRAEEAWHPAPATRHLLRALGSFDLADAERKTGVSVRRLQDVARAITGQAAAEVGVTRRPALALGGRGRMQDQWPIVALNALLGHISPASPAGGAPGGLRPVPELTLASLPPVARSTLRVDELPGAIGREIDLLILVGVNPAFASLQPSRWRDALQRARHVVCLTSFLDETATFADLILPLALPAERQDAYWNAAREGGRERAREGPGAVARALPPSLLVVEPALVPPSGVFSPADLVFELKKRLNVPSQSFPWATLTEAAADVVLSPPAVSAVRIPPAAVTWSPPPFTEGEFHLCLDTPVTLPRAEGAHLPYLLNTVGPHLREWWRTWVEVNPETAQRRGWHEREEVIVESQAGAIRARVRTFAGIPPDVVCMPVGLGHQIGQFAQKEGGNPLELVEWRPDDETRAPLWNAQKVTLRRA